MDDLELLGQWIDEEAVDVPQGEWDGAGAPEKLITTGLGPCAGVLVHNPKIKMALLGHFVEPRVVTLRNDFREMIGAARSKLGNVEDHKVYLAGVSPDDFSRDAMRYCEELRNYIVKMFIENGYSKSQVSQDWNRFGEAATLGVDTASGRVIRIKGDFNNLIG